MTVAEASFAVVSVIIESVTVASVLYFVVGAVTVAPGVLGCNIMLAASIWRNLPWFLVMVDWGHSVWVVVMYVVMLRLIYCGVRAGTVAPGVSGHEIMLAVSIWKTGPWFLVVVAWSRGVWVVVFGWWWWM